MVFQDDGVEFTVTLRYTHGIDNEILYRCAVGMSILILFFLMTTDTHTYCQLTRLKERTIYSKVYKKQTCMAPSCLSELWHSNTQHYPFGVFLSRKCSLFVFFVVPHLPYCQREFLHLLN